MIIPFLIIALSIHVSSSAKAVEQPKEAISIGAVQFDNTLFNVLIDRESFVGRLLGSPIFSIDSVRLELLSSLDVVMDLDQRAATMKAVVSFLSSAGFYYTKCEGEIECYDLSRSLACNRGENCAPEPYADYFVGNTEMLRLFKNNNVSGKFTKAIRGLVKMGCFDVQGELVCSSLIVRTSSGRTGPRLKIRGTDSDGNAGNCVEEETQVSHKRKVNSFVHLRGSIPFMWSQLPSWTNYFAPVDVHDECEGVTNQQAFDKHVDILYSLYPEMKIKFLSLIEEKEGVEMETTLATTYLALVKGSTKKDKFEFVPFNFNTAVSSEKKRIASDKEEAWFSALKAAVGLEAFNFTSFDGTTITQKQKSTIRTSCMSTLDRTSAVQRQLSDYMARKMLSDLAVPPMKPVTEMPPDMAQWMAYGWVDVANCIAWQYAGTDAKKNDLISTGKSTLMGRVKDVTWLTFLRHMNANHYDNHKRDIMRIIFGGEAVKEYNASRCAAEKVLGHAPGDVAEAIPA